LKRILVLSRAAFGPRISSPGIRAYHMSRVLAERVPGAAVTLAVPERDLGAFQEGLPFRVVPYNQASAVREIAAHDIIISTGFPVGAVLPFFWKTFVLDFFTQYFIEWLEAAGDDPGISKRRRRAWMSVARKFVSSQLTFADYILAANDRQRDTYIGSLLNLDLIRPSTYQRDSSLRKLVDVAPHGMRPDKLERTGTAVKGKYAGIRESDRLLLWNGGVLHWYDPATLLHAFRQICDRRDDVKLLFTGAFYPGLRTLGLGKRFSETIELARELGLYNRNVFFDVGWVPYEEMKNYLLETDLSVCTYFERLETHFSHRTRFLDVFWAEVPLVCTRGDVLADMVEEHRLGLTVSEGDVSGVAGAILQLLDDRDFYEECKRNLHGVRDSLSWEVVLEPLVEFCKNGRSIARPKRERLIPLVNRVASYAISRASLPLMR
jgi:glycosyltransferase involved in cell wall biosynthesis